MFISTKIVRRLLIAGLSVIAASASASSMFTDAQILIDRAIDSPTITVRYSGVSAALVEIRINGESLGTRTVPSAKTSGETNFTLNLSDLRAGDNEVEIRLFDHTGKLVAHDHTNIATEPVHKGPVFLSYPKTGASVLGPVEIKAGFAKELKDNYVSFFVDGTFKSMVNFPPYTYMWDTEKETNGWHELEAWSIDDSSDTHKTGKIRVFVNNPGGPTNRIGVEGTLGLARVLPTATLKTTSKGLKPVRVKTTAKLVDRKVVISPLPPATPPLGQPSNTKPFKVANGIPMGPRNMVPTGNRVAKAAPAGPRQIISINASQAVNQVTSAASLLPITRGSRLPNIGSFAIALDSALVDFHGVLPRVDDGVPMTPLRFLLEKKGGKVGWQNNTKTVSASAEGSNFSLHIGDPFALFNNATMNLERPSYLDHSRTIVPLSFIHSALKVNVQYDKDTHHVLITSRGK